jgi:hypothetical protein
VQVQALVFRSDTDQCDQPVIRRAGWAAGRWAAIDMCSQGRALRDIKTLDPLRVLCESSACGAKVNF